MSVGCIDDHPRFERREARIRRIWNEAFEQAHDPNPNGDSDLARLIRKCLPVLPVAHNDNGGRL